ncbi:FtsX-like permease family protein [Vitiosangium sp. GDMCC 1.1324]|uniref:ABC transporter permease n=1 Tax=Vitiosangium sp. (strain GDMCC 1.1324) TaxID=2138576 RepID=UPI000D334BDD|nr:FtsX-like permease family protein [Vitiosangium sp. GDMCC 1.1324]PTL79269.1 permease [Vitiosangium sp. GDMCC 1.1324]
MLVLFALQSVKARPHSWLVGLLAAGMALLLTLGLSLVASIYDGTRRSMIESGAGHLQVYHSASPEPPQMIIGPGGAPQLTPIADYPATEVQLRSVEGVQEVVPLEVGLGMVFRGNYLDEKLAAARAVVREPASEAREARLKRIGEDLARTVQRISHDSRRREEAFASGAEVEEDRRALEEAASETFWARFSTEPIPALEFLENHVAKQVGEGESIEVDLLGTDLPLFTRAFPRFELLSGQMPPPGTRGILLGQGAYEEKFKLPLAARLDELHRERERGGTLAEDERLRTLVTRNLTELPDLLARLDVERSTALQGVLARVLGHPGELEALLTEFLTLDDANFDARYALFYAELAPHLPMYRVRPGDMLVLKKMADDSPNVPVRVWGTYRFRGLGGDTSRVNATHLVDLVTLRALSGRLSRAQVEEARGLAKTLGFSDAPEPASSTSFGRPSIVDTEASKSAWVAPVFERVEHIPSTFTDDELRGDSILQAAVVLKPGASPEETAERIRQLAGERKLPLSTVGWEEVGGFVSGVVGMTQVLLVVLAALLGFFVLLVSAGTLLLLARERVGEVGTLRAVGMQRREVFLSLLLEGLLLGAVGSLVGIGLGAALLLFGAGGGIPVPDPSLQFFLGGAVLTPQLEAWQVLTVELCVVVWMMGAALVPAWRGSAVTPRVAMSRAEG